MTANLSDFVIILTGRGPDPGSSAGREQLAVARTCVDKLELSIMSRTRLCG